MIEGARRIKDLIRNQANGDSAKSQMLFRHFAMERFLERLSVSVYRNDFILKGGMLVSSFIGVDERTTRDIDATMRGHDMDRETIAGIFSAVAAVDLRDGFRFELGIPVDIMDDSEYGGVRIPVVAIIERSKTTFKLDVSTGDAITPHDVGYEYKLMFEDRCISLRAYNVETVLAEKLETILALAELNTRMRDYYDVWALMESPVEVKEALLGEALRATMHVRGSAYSFCRIDEKLRQLLNSFILLSQWERYQKANSYAAPVTWDAVMKSVGDAFRLAPGS